MCDKTNKKDDGFDFDAHVARLMEASARETGLRERTAGDNLRTKGLTRIRRAGDYSSDDSDSELESDENNSDGSGEFDETLLEGLDLGGGVGGGSSDGRNRGVLVEGGGDECGEGAEDRAVLDAQFEEVSVLLFCLTPRV